MGKVIPMDSKQALTPAEEALFDEVLVRRYDLCLSKSLKTRGLEGCARWAVEQAKALIEARRTAVISR